MATERTYTYFESSRQWSRELLVLFLLGFAAATLFWVGLWYWQARPAHADIVQAQETELEQTQGRLQQCTAEREKLSESNQQLERRGRELDQQLKNAWAAYSRAQLQK